MLKMCQYGKHMFLKTALTEHAASVKASLSYSWFRKKHLLVFVHSDISLFQTLLSLVENSQPNLNNFVAKHQSTNGCYLKKKKNTK